MPGSWFTGTCPARPGLTVPPQAFRLSAPLAARLSRLRPRAPSRCEHPPRLAETLIGHGPGELPVGDHARDVQVFDHDRLVPGRECGGGLVQRVRADVRGFSVQPGELGRRPTAVRRPGPLAGMAAGRAAPPPQGDAERFAPATSINRPRSSTPVSRSDAIDADRRPGAAAPAGPARPPRRHELCTPGSPSRGIVPGDRLHGPRCPVRRRPAPVQPGAQRGEDLRHIPYQVVVDLGRVRDQQPPPLR